MERMSRLNGEESELIECGLEMVDKSVYIRVLNHNIHTGMIVVGIAAGTLGLSGLFGSEGKTGYNSNAPPH